MLPDPVELPHIPKERGTLSRWLPPALLITLCAVFEAGGDQVRETLRFDRLAIQEGELWRLFTGHLVHLGWRHWLLNAAGVLLVWLLVGNRLGAMTWLALAVSIALGTSAGLWFLNPSLSWYVGLSGALHGFLVAGLVAALTGGQRSLRLEAVLLFAVVVAKLAYEQISGPLPGSEFSAGGRVVVDAHLYGAVAGFMAIWPFLIRAKRARPI